MLFLTQTNICWYSSFLICFRYFIIYSKKEFIMGCYDSGYIYVRNRKHYLEIPAFLLIEWEGKNQSIVMTSQQLRWVLFVVFIFNWIFCSGTSLFKIQKDSNFQIIFPIPYQNIYNPGYDYYLFLTSRRH